MAGVGTCNEKKRRVGLRDDLEPAVLTVRNAHLGAGDVLACPFPALIVARMTAVPIGPARGFAGMR